MECNKDEAVRAKGIALSKMMNNDFEGARKIALKAKKLYPELDNISQLLAVCDVHCSAQKKINGPEKDLYGFLQVESLSDESTIRKQYLKLALLHPDKNKLPGAEAAFKLIGEANMILSDKGKRYLHDFKRRDPSKPTISKPQNPQKPQNSQGESFGRPSFWTYCPICKTKYEYYRDVVNKIIKCPKCAKFFTAVDIHQSSQPPQPGHFGKQNVNPGSDTGRPASSQPVHVGKQGNAKADSQRTKPSFSQFAQHPPKCARTGDTKDSGSSLGNTTENGNVKTKGEKEGIASKETGSKNSVASESNCKDAESQKQPCKRSQVSDSDGAVNDFIPAKKSRKRKSSSYVEDTQKDKGCDTAELNKEYGEGSMPNDKNKDKDNLKEDVKSDSDSKDDPEPVFVDIPDLEFCNFFQDKEEHCFAAEQIWAVYDTIDSMPRFYAYIKKVYKSEFKLMITWFEADPENKLEKKWVEGGLPVACGRFKRGNSEETKDRLMFSHKITYEKGSKKNSLVVYPKKGETWALFRDWDIKWSVDSENHMKYKFEIVEILSDYDKENGVVVAFMVKVEGFVSLFQKTRRARLAEHRIPTSELFRFSHRIPSLKLTGNERADVPVGSFELDTASLPDDFDDDYFSNNLKAKPEKVSEQTSHQSPKEHCFGIASKETGSKNSVASESNCKDAESQKRPCKRSQVSDSDGAVNDFIPAKKSRKRKSSSYVEDTQKDKGCDTAELNKEYGEGSMPNDKNKDKDNLKEDVKSDSDSKDDPEPVFVDIPDLEFCNFFQDKEEHCFAAEQIWAVYDTIDSMPRFYAYIKKVYKSEFKLMITWFEADPENKLEKKWVEGGLPVACGRFKRGNSEETKDRLMFSHKITYEKGSKKNSLVVYPKKGETWALFRDWDIKWSVDSENHMKYKFEIVEILSDYDKENGVVVAFMVKVEGFVSLFQKTRRARLAEHRIPTSELFRFSHRIPSLKLTGNERADVPVGSFELDTASLPDDFDDDYFSNNLKAKPEKVSEQTSHQSPKEHCFGIASKETGSKNSVASESNCKDAESQKRPCKRSQVSDSDGAVNDFIPAKKSRKRKSSSYVEDTQKDKGCDTAELNKEYGEGSMPNDKNKDKDNLKEDVKSDSDSKDDPEPVFVDIPDLEFCNFFQDKEEHCFAAEQIWAIYDTIDSMPRFYAYIKKVYKSEFKLMITWFEADPENKLEKKWVEGGLPVACGRFKRGNSEETKDRLMFSHKITYEKGSKKNSLVVYPKKGETWALFRDWDIKWSVDSENHMKYKFEIVEILSDYDKENGVVVAFMVKVEGFVSLFQKTRRARLAEHRIPTNELFRFSHRIPSLKLTGNERADVPVGSFELDTASLPDDFDDDYFSNNLKAKPEKVSEQTSHQSPKEHCFGIASKETGSKNSVASESNCKDAESQKRPCKRSQVSDSDGAVNDFIPAKKSRKRKSSSYVEDTQKDKGCDTAELNKEYGEGSMPNDKNKDKDNLKEDVKSDSDYKDDPEPVFVDIPDLEFCNFFQDKEEHCFAAEQIWAVYDTIDSMPRFYAYIKKVYKYEFKLMITWFEADPENKLEKKWVEGGLPVACGRFKRGNSEETKDRLMFSHKITYEKGSKKNSLVVYPKKGETWALFRDWDIKWSVDSENHMKYKFEIVEILSDYDKENGVVVAFMVKVEGFVSLFQKTSRARLAEHRIPTSELFRFSHRIPSLKLTGNERADVPVGSFELDTASLPDDFDDDYFSNNLKAKPEKVSEETSHQSPKTKMKKNEFDKETVNIRKSPRGLKGNMDRAENTSNDVSNGFIKRPEPSSSPSDKDAIIVHDFNLDKKNRKFEVGQIWALNLKCYAQIKEIETSSQRLHVDILELCCEAIRPNVCGLYRASKDGRQVFQWDSFLYHVKAEKNGKNRFNIYPREKEIWVLYKKQESKCTFSDIKAGDCEFVEVVENNGDNITVFSLSRVGGYKSVFRAYERTLQIPISESDRFFYRVPAFYLTDEQDGQLRGYWELDFSEFPGLLPI